MEINKEKRIHDMDLSLDPMAKKYEKISTVRVTFAEDNGIIKTLEGNVAYEKGDAILTGIHDENWPVERHIFDSQYELANFSIANEYRKSQGAIIYAKKIKNTFCIKIRNGTSIIEGKPGDWLVQYAMKDWGIIDDDIFKKSYRIVSDS
ncbi:PGDYG domain-containing protein [Sulfuriferula nivalis]|uniref:Uncharacterized protein n=1 Tax=Sulfuriferula nivalis TaxID=2675298 RepID=A0A809SI43_9PROT|nr:PGDYG domain-containing protein [Sulfuriferula nivalis]BBP01400.1 hypothetical protein SFSGTM_21080 [Sulfuriferula nivalis]